MPYEFNFATTSCSSGYALIVTLNHNVIFRHFGFATRDDAETFARTYIAQLEEDDRDQA